MSETRALPVPLSEQELIIKGNELSVLLQDLDEIETQKKDANSAFKAEIDKLSAQVQGLAKIVRERKEYRNVEVTERRNEERLTMDTIRLDTGEVISYRELQGHERNLALFPAEVMREAAAAMKGGE